MKQERSRIKSQGVEVVQRHVESVEEKEEEEVFKTAMNILKESRSCGGEG